ncbi:Uncharacterised protein [Mycobacterium tuberculosis]|nr:Uncharacterised protein [Mycobacterium tuberculosis]
MRRLPLSSVLMRITGWLLPKKAVSFTGMLAPSCTAPALN